MKKIYIYLFYSLLIISNIQCSDLLDKTTYGVESEETFYQTQTEIEEALTETYLQLRITWNEYAKNHDFIGDITTDDAWKGGASNSDLSDLYSLSNFIVYPTNSVVSTRWEILYLLINRANDVIYYAPDAEGDADTLTQYINEAKLLRAFGYYELVTTFGKVPLVLEPITPEESYSIARASTDSVYAQIVADLTDATALPSKSEYDTDNQYRVTSGLAYTLLGKTYMFQQKYEKAEEALKAVIESGEYSLLADFGYNWRKEYENSSESVFEIPNSIVTKDLATGTNVPHFFTTRNTTNYQGYGFHQPTQDLFDEFDAEDPRITYTFTMTGDRYLEDVEDQDNSLATDGYHDRKIEVPYFLREDEYAYCCSYNIRLIRYSDVLLLYAEALNEDGKSTEALTYLNEVRERARSSNPEDPLREAQTYVPATDENTLPDITTTDQDELRDAIWHERRCELAMEGWRRDDLMRQKRFGDVMRAFAEQYDCTKGANFDDDRDYLLPIPQDEIDYSNGTITQNYGY